uniref:Uncharacterized protein n=1 Tax=Timema shepardi TaxID=629360 RepID=A0A7R9APS7_TIMSH|nr:unnamed protein product [Timema shepardi]
MSVERVICPVESYLFLHTTHLKSKGEPNSAICSPFQNLEDKERKHAIHKENLNREHRYLRRRLDQLSMTHAHTALSKRRSVSECSNSTSSSTNSSGSSSAESGTWPLYAASEPLRSRPASKSPASVSSISESDEVDVIGYTSNQSDTDDHSSVQSTSSDSGVAMSTSRLTLSEMDMRGMLSAVLNSEGIQKIEMGSFLSWEMMLAEWSQERGTRQRLPGSALLGVRGCQVNLRAASVCNTPSGSPICDILARPVPDNEMICPSVLLRFTGKHS